MRRLAFILTAIAALLSGCAKDRVIDLRGDGFEPDPTLDQKYRPDEASDKNPSRSSSQRNGFSTKARDIESRLGVD